MEGEEEAVTEEVVVAMDLVAEEAVEDSEHHLRQATGDEARDRREEITEAAVGVDTEAEEEATEVAGEEVATVVDEDDLTRSKIVTCRRRQQNDEVGTKFMVTMCQLSLEMTMREILTRFRLGTVDGCRQIIVSCHGCNEERTEKRENWTMLLAKAFGMG